MKVSPRLWVVAVVTGATVSAAVGLAQPASAAPDPCGAGYACFYPNTTKDSFNPTRGYKYLGSAPFFYGSDTYNGTSTRLYAGDGVSSNVSSAYNNTAYCLEVFGPGPGQVMFVPRKNWFNVPTAWNDRSTHYAIDNSQC